MGNSVYSKSDEKEFYPTEDWVRNVLYTEIDKCNFKTILDPCCGSGGLEKFDSNYEYDLYDIEDHGVNAHITDFLKTELDKHYDCAVINPPFGLTVEFIQKAKKYTNHIFLIAPIKTVLKNFGEAIKWVSFDINYCYKCFGIMTSIALYHLDFNYKKFGTPPGTPYKKFLGEKIPKEKTWANHFYETNKAPDKFFIVDRLTKARVVRGEQLIYDSDLYGPKDESAFIAVSSNTNVKAGDRILRRICEFNSFEEMKAFQQKYIENEKSLRDYMYLWGNTILRQDEKPWL